SERPLAGARVIDASGLVVAPGFIDLHQHDQTAAGYRLKAMDGVTTALELEIGPPDVRKFLDQRRNTALINYGTTASHPWARAAIFGRPAVGDGEIVPPSGPATNDPATPEQVQRMQQRLRDELNAGGLGVGMGIQYTPGATRQEIIEMFRVAAERGVPVFVHRGATASNRWARSSLRLRSPVRRCISPISTAVACARLPNVCAWLPAHAAADLM